VSDYSKGPVLGGVGAFIKSDRGRSSRPSQLQSPSHAESRVAFAELTDMGDRPEDSV
jgi:hypothetical protein